jgi:endonuclease YncB( thermonuclease family)
MNIVTLSDWKRNPAIVTRVVDGDTVEVVADIGWSVSVKATVRLAQINAPERDTPEGKAAADFVRSWLADKGSSVTLYSFRQKDKYGRHLANLVAADGSDLGAALVLANHAEPWNGKGPKP